MKKNMLGHPQFIKLYDRYKAIFNHYLNGGCTAQEMLEAIEALEKLRGE